MSRKGSAAPKLKSRGLRIVARGKNKSPVELPPAAEAQSAASRLAAIVESAEDAIASKDLNGIITSWNAAAERIFGYQAQEIIGRPVTTIIPPELHPDEAVILSKIRRGERIEHFETVRVTKSGERIDVSLTISPMRDEKGKVIGAAKILRNITEAKRTREALRRAEKMAATGRLAAAIAHEINNPMQSLTNLLVLLGSKTSLDDDSRAIVEQAEAELGRISHITRQMLSFYRESTVAGPVKLADILDDVLDLFALRIRTNQVRVQRRYESAGEMEGYPVELRQLAANLVGNAIEAVGQRGNICIHLRPWWDLSDPDTAGLRLVISDNGPGIPEDVRPRVFEPFFTTKTRRGTGLGLWVVAGIVGKHGGSIRLRSTTDPKRHGTFFSVFLPLSRAQSARTSPAADERPRESAPASTLSPH